MRVAAPRSRAGLLGRRLAALGCALAYALTAAAQPAAAPETPTQPPAGAASRPTSTPFAPAYDLPPEVAAALATVRDYAFDFDQAGFYAVAEYMKRNRALPGAAEQPTVVSDWRTLVERPNDFRGRPVTITGVVGHNRSWKLRSRPELGDFWQVELRGDEQPVAATVIFTQIADDVPLGSTISVTGYFVMMRSYYDRKNHAQQALLLVAPGPTSMSAGPTDAARDDFAARPQAWAWLIGAVGVGLVIAVVMLRRAAARPANAFAAIRERASAAGAAVDATGWDDPADSDAASASYRSQARGEDRPS